MIANFCHYIQENQDVRSKLSEPLKSQKYPLTGTVIETRQMHVY